MAWRVNWNLECDHCRAKGTFRGGPSPAVEKKARKAKWVFTIDTHGLFRHLCPTCGSNAEVVELYQK